MLQHEAGTASLFESLYCVAVVVLHENDAPSVDAQTNKMRLMLAAEQKDVSISESTDNHTAIKCFADILISC